MALVSVGDHAVIYHRTNCYGRITDLVQAVVVLVDQNVGHRRQCHYRAFAAAAVVVCRMIQNLVAVVVAAAAVEGEVEEEEEVNEEPLVSQRNFGMTMVT